MDNPSTTVDTAGIAASLMFLLAMGRVGYIIAFAGDPAPDLWRRRWIEVGMMLTLAVGLGLLSVYVF